MARNKSTILIHSNIDIADYEYIKEKHPNISAFVRALVKKYVSDKKNGST